MLCGVSPDPPHVCRWGDYSAAVATPEGVVFVATEWNNELTYPAYLGNWSTRIADIAPSGACVKGAGEGGDAALPYYFSVHTSDTVHPGRAGRRGLRDLRLGRLERAARARAARPDNTHLPCRGAVYRPGQGRDPQIHPHRYCARR